MWLAVYPTSRAIASNLQLRLKKNQGLESTCTIGDFFARSIVVPNRVKIDDESRIVLLNEATKFSEYSKLGFEVNFLSFLKNYEFILKFFSELYSENVSISDISLKDFSGEFIEHIEILTILLKNYIKLLDQNGFYDSFYKPNLYINKNYIKRFDLININVVGYLTNSELFIIDDVSKICDVVIDIEINQFNKKMFDKFNDFGINIQDDGSYKIDFSKKNIIQYSKITPTIPSFDINSFALRSNQVHYIFDRLSYYINELKIEPQNIAIILPDESFQSTLEIFDKHRNLNYAFGISIKNTLYFQKLNAIYKLYFDDSQESEQRVVSLGLEEIYKKYEPYFNVSNFEQFISLISNIEYDSNTSQIIQSNIYKLSKLKPYLQTLKFINLLWYYISSLQTQSIDDIGGGKIKVIGVLESRSLSFDAIIIPDFNEGIVPKSSSKDLFLNSTIKTLSNLPTIKDREDLQRFFYHKLIYSTKYISICYVHNDELIASRFLGELDIPKTNNSDDKYQYLNRNFTPIFHGDEEFEYEDKTIKTLSASKLKTFLECKMKYYYQYILKIKPHSYTIVPKPYIAGLIFHEILKDIYEKQNSFNSAKELSIKVKSYLIKYMGNEYTNFNLDLWMKKLTRFFEYEVERFNSGHIVYQREKRFRIKYNKELELNGSIDRVDIKDNALHIIDYKFKDSPILFTKLENETQFQLEFYHIAAKELFTNPIKSTYLYDVKNAKLLQNIDINARLDALYKHIDSYTKDSWLIQKNRSNQCQFCDFALMCLK